MATPPSQDLATLIGQAETEERRKAAAALARARGPAAGDKRRWLGPATALAVVAASLSWVHAWRGHWLSRDVIERDLRVLVDQAQAQVERYRERHGTLPAALPDLTLGTVVSYRVDAPTATPPRYSLVARLRDVEVRGPAPVEGSRP